MKNFFIQNFFAVNKLDKTFFTKTFLLIDATMSEQRSSKKIFYKKKNFVEYKRDEEENIFEVDAQNVFTMCS
jgi:hypothetical protein